MKFNKVIRVNPITRGMAMNFAKTLEQNKRETERKKKRRKKISKAFEKLLNIEIMKLCGDRVQ